MSVHLNPIFYLKQAWDATGTVWGKLAIILFYLFVWLQIIFGVIVLISPSFSVSCFFEGMGDYEYSLFMASQRISNVFGIGFLLYADRGGIRVWNVAMVFAVFAAFGWIGLAWPSMAAREVPDKYEQLQESGCLDGFQAMYWTQIIWPLLALVCAIFEAKHQGGVATSGEREPLV